MTGCPRVGGHEVGQEAVRKEKPLMMRTRMTDCPRVEGHDVDQEAVRKEKPLMMRMKVPVQKEYLIN